MSVEEFIAGIKGTLSPYRLLCVDEAFDKIDIGNKGSIDQDHFFLAFNGKNHPDVKVGRKNEDDALKDFIDYFGLFCAYKGYKAGCDVTREDFVEFYSFESLGIESDHTFHLCLSNIWRSPDPANYTWAQSKFEGGKGNNLAASALEQSSRIEKSVQNQIATPKRSEADFDFQIAKPKEMENESIHSHSEFHNLPSKFNFFSN